MQCSLKFINEFTIYYGVQIRVLCSITAILTGNEQDEAAAAVRVSFLCIFVTHCRLFDQIIFSAVQVGYLSPLIGLQPIVPV